MADLYLVALDSRPKWRWPNEFIRMFFRRHLARSCYAGCSALKHENTTAIAFFVNTFLANKDASRILEGVAALKGWSAEECDSKFEQFWLNDYSDSQRSLDTLRKQEREENRSLFDELARALDHLASL